MRQAITALLLIALASPAFAQDDSPQMVYRQAMMVENQFRELDSSIRLLAKGLRRDAFIVVQVMAAGRELTDFQQQVALQKAADRLANAYRKGLEKPEADGRTMAIIRRLEDRVKKAKDQGLSADIAGVREDLLRGAGDIQYFLFRDLEALRNVRKIYGEIQGRNGATIADFDDALGEALGAALEMLEVKVTE